MKIPYKKQQIENAIKKASIGIDRRFKCKFCELDYASPSGRRRHEKSEHPDISAAKENFSDSVRHD